VPTARLGALSKVLRSRSRSRLPQPFAADIVIVTPHAAGHSRDSHERQGMAMVEEIERFRRGEPLRCAIAAERYELLA